MGKIREGIVKAWRKLNNLRETPHAIALGAGIGLAWNFIPSLGVGPILSIVSAKALRASGIAAVTVNLATGFFIPLLYSLNFIVGRTLIGQSSPEVGRQLQDSLHESLGTIEQVVEAPTRFFSLSRITDAGLDFIFGSIVNAAMAVCGVYAMLWFVMFVKSKMVWSQ
ncbi:MAG: DUF2062 domain-containing protein [Firmicutes bacterium]|nr:DUF2062 domain-containing protein [Bacillota bacterium]